MYYIIQCIILYNVLYYTMYYIIQCIILYIVFYYTMYYIIHYIILYNVYTCALYLWYRCVMYMYNVSSEFSSDNTSIVNNAVWSKLCVLILPTSRENSLAGLYSSLYV